MFHLDVYHKMKELLPDLDYVKDPEKFISLEILARLSKWDLNYGLQRTMIASILWIFLNLINVVSEKDKTDLPNTLAANSSLK